MKLRCPRQHRIGEVCGAKLVDHESVTKVDDDCKLCQEIGVKERRLQKEKANIDRWSREGNKFSASIEKARREAQSLESLIEEMRGRRPSVNMKNNWENRGGPIGNSMPGAGSVSASSYMGNQYGSQSSGGYDHGQFRG